MKPSHTLINNSTATADNDDDDEPDEWDKRIMDTGCHQENLKLQLCHADTGDWRKCLKEMQAFRACWERNKNNERTSTVDNTETK